MPSKEKYKLQKRKISIIIMNLFILAGSCLNNNCRCN